MGREPLTYIVHVRKTHTEGNDDCFMCFRPKSALEIVLQVVTAFEYLKEFQSISKHSASGPSDSKTEVSWIIFNFK